MGKLFMVGNWLLALTGIGESGKADDEIRVELQLQIYDEHVLDDGRKAALNVI